MRAFACRIISCVSLISGDSTTSNVASDLRKVCQPKLSFVSPALSAAGQVSDGLDAFYKDYRNRSIRVVDAMWVVANSIAGTPQKEIDAMTENFRKYAQD
jgi:hypothetical protein